MMTKPKFFTCYIGFYIIDKEWDVQLSRVHSYVARWARTNKYRPDISFYIVERIDRPDVAVVDLIIQFNKFPFDNSMVVVLGKLDAVLKKTVHIYSISRDVGLVIDETSLLPYQYREFIKLPEASNIH